MIKNPIIFIEHILENITDIESFVKNVTKEDFLKDKEKQNAVIRSLEVVGEAVKNLPQDITSKYPNTPWKKIAGTRDKIIHHYFMVNLDVVWEIIKKDIPELKKEILIIREDLEK